MKVPQKIFEFDLNSGKILCLLPISRVKVERPAYLSENIVVYPQGQLKSKSFRIVSFPKHEWQQAARRSETLRKGMVHASGTDLAWVKSGATGIGIEEFFNSDLLALTINLDWDSFLAPNTHEAHLDMIRLALGQAEEILDLIRFDYCRIDLSQTLPGRAGFLPDNFFTAALFYSQKNNESYIVAGEIVTHHIVAGLGLELDCITPVERLGDGEVGKIARHGLRMHTMGLEAADDTAKFVQFMTLIEYLAEPNNFIGMNHVKRHVGRHVAKKRAEYEEIMDDFKFLTSEGGSPQAPNRGLRHNIFHLGRRLEDLLAQGERKAVLLRLERYSGVMLQDMINRSTETWDAIIEYRRMQGEFLGLDAISEE